MKSIYHFLLLSACNLMVKAQPANTIKTGSGIIPVSELVKIISPEVLNKLTNAYPIYRVYKNYDASGGHYILLAESRDSIAGNTGSDTFNFKIRAVKIKPGASQPDKIWEINDFRVKQEITGEMETSMWFWTKYCLMEDIDKDNLIDPILVYGTNGINGTDDGRIKILIFYKDRKVAIRHQNSTLDFERNTRVDKEFYNLPVSLQRKVRAVMQQIVENKAGIFPNGWQKAMDKKQVYFNETNK